MHLFHHEVFLVFLKESGAISKTPFTPLDFLQNNLLRLVYKTICGVHSVQYGQGI